MNFHRLIFSSIFLFVVQITNAQGGATIKATVDKNRILIGQPLQLTIEARLSQEATTSFVNIDSINHFEFLGKPLIDSANEDGSRIIKEIYKITSFDSGHWVIPSFILSKGIKTDTIPVDVLFSEVDPNQDYHDIKDIIEVAPPKKKQWWWYIAGGVLLLAIITIYLFRKKKPAPIAVPAVLIKDIIQYSPIFSGFIFSGRKEYCPCRKQQPILYCN
jgi:LPXTG-motif cell wall-anchored protein